MSETKYLSVIHKPSGKLVTAFKFDNDATWIGKEKNILIATPLYCEEGQEIKMVFVKSFTRQNETQVAAYFRKKQGETDLKSSLNGESIGHRLSKENIYSGLLSGELTINKEKLDKDIVKDIIIESRTYGEDYIIFDVVVLFKKEHIKYGLGIFFEIQFSKQKNSETIKRSYDRIMEGFSGVWLFKDDFDYNYKLINKNISVNSYKKTLDKIEILRESNFIKRINKYGEIIDNKFDDFNLKLNTISDGYIRYCENELSSKILKSQIDNAVNICSNNISKIKITAKDEIEKLNISKENTKNKLKDLENIKEQILNNIESELLDKVGYTKQFIEDKFKEINIDKEVDKLIEEITEKCKGRKNEIMAGVWKR